MKINGRLEKILGDAFRLHLDPNQVRTILGSNHNRLKCTYKNQMWFSTLIHINADESYIMINNALTKKLRLESKSEIYINIEADHRVYKCTVPPELLEELHENPEVNNVFHLQPESRQRSIIYKIKSILEPNERKRKARMTLMSLL